MDKRFKIFLVDDDEMFLEMIHDILSDNEDYKLYKFKSGEACLKCMELKPDLILLDHYFGKAGRGIMNGLEALGKILECRPEQKVIMLTGQEDGQRVFEFISRGASDYIIKDEHTFKRIKNIVQEYFDEQE